MQTSQAVPLCTHLSRVPWKYLSGHSHPLLHFLSGSCTRSPLGFSCYLNSAKGTELPVWELLPRQRAPAESATLSSREHHDRSGLVEADLPPEKEIHSQGAVRDP